MKNKIFKTVLILGAIYAISALVYNFFGLRGGEAVLGVLVLLFVLKLIKEKKILEVKTVIWFALLNSWIYITWVLIS